MKIEKNNKKVLIITVDQSDYNLNEYYDNLIFLETKISLHMVIQTIEYLKNILNKMDITTSH